MACINQYSVDALGYSNFNENIEKFSGLPRPAKWLGNKKIKTLIEKFSNILNFAWTFCFAYVYFFIIALRFIFSLKGRSRYGINIKNVDNLVLGVAPRSVFVFKSRTRLRAQGHLVVLQHKRRIPARLNTGDTFGGVVGGRIRGRRIGDRPGHRLFVRRHDGPGAGADLRPQRLQLADGHRPDPRHGRA